MQARCEIALAEIAAESGMIRDIHNVRVRETDDGEIVNFHCRVDPVADASQAVHEKVDEVERDLRRRSPSIKRVIGHAEPRELKRTSARGRRSHARPRRSVSQVEPQMPASLNTLVRFAVSSLMILSIAAGVSVTPIRN